MFPSRAFRKAAATRRHVSLLAFSLVALGALLAPAPARAAPKQAPPADAFDQSQLAALEWRCIGPWRGGRVTAVTGVPGQRNVYYFGGTGGGIWKSLNSGVDWVRSNIL